MWRLQCRGPLPGSQSQKNWVNAEECANRNERHATILPASSNSRRSVLHRAEPSDCQRVEAPPFGLLPAACLWLRSPQSAAQGGTPVPGSTAPSQLCGETTSTSPCEIAPPSAYFLPATGCQSPRQLLLKDVSSFLSLFLIGHGRRQ